MNEVNFYFDGNYLAAEIEDTSKIIKYQMEMLVHTDINYLLPVKKQMKNNKVNLYYEVTGKMALSRLVTRNKMPDTAYIGFAKRTLEMAQELNEYQLVSKGVVIDNQYIFVDTAEYMPYYIYVPIYSDENSGDKNSIISYLKNMLVSDIIEITDSNIIQQAISILNSPISLNEMILRFSKLDTKQKPNNVSDKPKPIESKPYELSPVKEQKEEKAAAVINPERKEPEKRPAAQPIPKAPIVNTRKEVKHDIKAEKTDGNDAVEAVADKKKIIPIMAAASVIVAVIFGALVFSGTFNDEEGNTDYTCLIALPIVMFAVDYFIYYNLKNKFVIAKKEKVQTNSGKNKKEVSVPVVEVKPKQLVNNEPLSEKPSAPQSVQAPILQINNEVQFADFGKTELFTGNDEASPYLQGKQGDIIKITGNTTRIGKLKERVDHAISNNKNVSRVHADIIMRDGKMYVMDLGSANGTYINGNPQRITSNMEYELHNNDMVGFANEEYIVHC